MISGTQTMERMFSAMTDSDSTKRASARASADMMACPLEITSFTIDCGERLESVSPSLMLRTMRVRKALVIGSSRMIIPRSALNRRMARSRTRLSTSSRLSVELMILTTS